MMFAGQVYRCTNRRCNCEVIVSKGSQTEGGSLLRCCCGSQMKKPYTAPSLHEFSGSDRDRLRSLFKRQ